MEYVGGGELFDYIIKHGKVIRFFFFKLISLSELNLFSLKCLGLVAVGLRGKQSLAFRVWYEYITAKKVCLIALKAAAVIDWIKKNEFIQTHLTNVLCIKSYCNFFCLNKMLLICLIDVILLFNRFYLSTITSSLDMISFSAEREWGSKILSADHLGRRLLSQAHDRPQGLEAGESLVRQISERQDCRFRLAFDFYFYIKKKLNLWLA